MSSVGVWVIIFHFSMVIIGAWFLINLAIAVITKKFSEQHESRLEQKSAKKKVTLKRFGADDADDDGDDEEKFNIEPGPGEDPLLLI